VYEPDEAAVVGYARASTLLLPIDDELYSELARHFDVRQIFELCMTIGLANQINRFHATFLTDLDDAIGAALGASCPLPLPPEPGTR
jgi:alkylhydroperoxidase family enzyme